MSNLDVVYKRIEGFGRPVWQHELYMNLYGIIPQATVRRCFIELRKQGKIKKGRDGYTAVKEGEQVPCPIYLNNGKIFTPITFEEIGKAKKIIKNGSKIYGYDHRYRDTEEHNGGQGKKRWFHIKACYPFVVFCEENISFTWVQIAMWLRDKSKPIS